MLQKSTETLINISGPSITTPRTSRSLSPFNELSSERKSSPPEYQTIDICKSPPSKRPRLTNQMNATNDLDQQAKEGLIVYYRPLLKSFIESEHEQYQCTNDLTIEQIFIIQSLAEELGLCHATKENSNGNTLFIYKNKVNIPIQQNSQVLLLIFIQTYGARQKAKSIR